MMDLNGIQRALEIFCDAADECENDQLCKLLSDEKFTKCLSRFWKRLPRNVKSTVNEKSTVNGESRKRYKANPTRKLSKIVMSEKQEQDLSRWSNDFHTFFVESEPNVPNFPYLLSSSYNLLLETECRGYRDIVRTRILKVLFYQLKDRFCVTYLRTSTVQRIAQLIRGSGVVDGDESTIICNVQRWASTGRKCDLLCRELAQSETIEDYRYLGYVFCLPDDVHDTYLKYLQDEGEHRLNKIKHLVARGILDVDKKETMSDLAQEIFSHLWTAINSFISNHGECLLSIDEWHRKHIRVLRLENSRPETTNCPVVQQPTDVTQNSEGGLGLFNSIDQVGDFQETPINQTRDQWPSTRILSEPADTTRNDYELQQGLCRRQPAHSAYENTSASALSAEQDSRIRTSPEPIVPSDQLAHTNQTQSTDSERPCKRRRNQGFGPSATFEAPPIRNPSGQTVSVSCNSQIHQATESNPVPSIQQVLTRSHLPQVSQPGQNEELERATNPSQSQTTLQQCGVGTRPVSGHYLTQSASYPTDEHSTVRLDGNDPADLGRFQTGHANTSSYNERASADSGFIEPMHANVIDPNTAYQTTSFDTNFTVPATPYRPGLFDTNCTGPSIHYQPGLSNMNATNSLALYQLGIFDTNSTIPAVRYQTPLFDTNSTVPDAPYHPSLLSTDSIIAPGVPNSRGHDSPQLLGAGS